MNQMQKRLEIIKIAISMTDEETVKLQLLKLEHFENDADLSEIIILLKQKYYAKAQSLIVQYNSQTERQAIHDTPKEILSEQAEEKSSSRAIINEFALLKPINKNSITKIIDKSNYNNDDICAETNNKVSNKLPQADNLIVSDNNEVINNTEVKQVIVVDDKTIKNNELLIETDDICIQTDNYSEYVANYKKQFETNNESIAKEIAITKEIVNKEQQDEDNTTEKEAITNSKEVILSTEANDSSMYNKIPDISTIFHNKASKYLSKPIMSVKKSASAWMKHIANRGYTDDEISKMSTHIKKLKNTDNLTEASQLTLVCGSTESYLGRLIFARELIKGDLFAKDETQAFELIKELALSGYDEAICDYGQLVEHGIGTEADPAYAEELYKDAVNLDSERGRRLYETIRKKNHKFLSFFKG